jgi:hypothetical protein
MWNLILVCLDMVLVSVQGWCMVCAKSTIGQKSFWTHPMVLHGDVAQLEACFGVFRDSANLDVKSLHGLRRTYHRLRNHF